MQLIKQLSFYGAVTMLAVLTACMPQPNEAYQNRGNPESLLDVSSEVVNLSIAGKSETDALADWVAKDAPTRAELYCVDTTPSCVAAKRILEARNVDVSIVPSPNNTATLTYERILAHDCNPRYLDNGLLLYAKHSPSFGCATSANLVQQVSDKRSFVNPSLSDSPSAIGAVNMIRNLNEPKKQEASKPDVSTSLVKSGKTN